MRAEWAATMNCPRCGASLLEQESNGNWLIFFECKECWRAFELVVEGHFEHRGHPKGRRFLRHTTTLQPGRTPLPATWREK
jgi:transposase-like protein